MAVRNSVRVFGLEHAWGNPLAYFYLIGLASVLVTGFFAFSSLGGGVFFSWDSASYIAFANESLTNGVPLQLGPSFDQSLGNITYPVDFWLIPEAVLSFRGGHVHPVAFYLIVAALFYSCAFLALALFEFGPWVALIAACSFTLLTLPYSSPVLFTELYWWHAPFMIPTVYMAFALLASYYLIGRLPHLWNLVMVVALSLAVTWTIAGYPKLSAVIFVGVALFCLIFTLGSQSWRELAWKAGASGFVLLVVLACGPWDYMRGIYGNTSNSVFASEALSETGALDWRGLFWTLFTPFHPSGVWQEVIVPNLVWVKYHMGYTLPALAIVGAGCALASREWPRPVKLLAIGVLLLFPFSFVCIYASINPAQINYLLFAFAMVPLADLARRTRLRWYSPCERLCRALRLNRRALALGIVLLAAVLAGMSMRRYPPGGFPYPPSRPAVVNYLRQEIGFSDAMQFRGRYLNLLPADSVEAPFNVTTASSIVTLSARLAFVEGNDLTYASLREDDIPVTIEYNRMSTPISATFHNFLLVRSGDIDRIDYRAITIFDPRLLGLIGVRYVLASAAPNSPSVRVAFEHPLSSRVDVKLYEITDVNLGGYSPTTLRHSADIRESLELLSRPDFDPRQEALVNDDVRPQSLAPATEVAIRRVQNGLHVKARSEGWSYIVLPFEFSRCLVVDAADGKSPQSVERADVVLTGVLFKRETEFTLRFLFGPFTNSDCRSRDIVDTRAMKLDRGTLTDLQGKYPGKLSFTGFQ